MKSMVVGAVASLAIVGASLAQAAELTGYVHIVRTDYITLSERVSFKLADVETSEIIPNDCNPDGWFAIDPAPQHMMMNLITAAAGLPVIVHTIGCDDFGCAIVDYFDVVFFQ